MQVPLLTILNFIFHFQTWCNVIFSFNYFFSLCICLFILLFLQCLLRQCLMNFWKRSYLDLLLYPMNSLSCILLVYVLLHLLLQHHWLLMSLMNCCGPLMEMTFMYNALNFTNLLLLFLLINLLLIPFSCILILISLIFILFYYILKQLVIFVGNFSTLTLVCIWKRNLISFPMPLHLHLLLILARRFLFLYFLPCLLFLGFHFNLDVVISRSSPFIQVNVHPRNEVTKRIDYEFHVREPISKSRFLDIDDKELENVNKGGWRVNKHIKLWAMNMFDEWRLLRDFDTRKSIVDMFKDEGSIKDLVDMLSSFVL